MIENLTKFNCSSSIGATQKQRRSAAFFNVPTDRYLQYFKGKHFFTKKIVQV